ncbi:MAG: pyridoxamine 5'-phosphate oxidase family protein [Acidobacteriota bacterium]
MPKLTLAEREAFLDEPGILLRIATVDESGFPHVTPIWFLHEGGFVYFTPRERSAWFGHLRADPRVALCIDEQPLPYRKVVIRGRAELLHDLGEDDDWRDLYRQIAKRYVPEEQAEGYVQGTIDQPRALYRVGLDEATVRSWRMPLDDEPQHGIWHERYYREGSLMAQQIAADAPERNSDD